MEQLKENEGVQMDKFDDQKTGIDVLMLADIAANLIPGELVLLCGRFSQTMTEVAIQFAQYAVNAENKNVLFFSLEHDKEALHFEIPEQSGKGMLCIYDEPAISVEQVQQVVTEMENKNQITVDMLVIDCVSLMSTKDQGTRLDGIEKNVQALYELAIQKNLIIISGCLLSRYPGRIEVFPLREIESDYGKTATQLAKKFMYITHQKGRWEIVLKSQAENDIIYRYRNEWEIMKELDENCDKIKNMEIHNINTDTDWKIPFDEIHKAYVQYEEKKKEELDSAIGVAVKYHEGQRDKQGENYIFHPLRVMMKMPNELGKTVAVLHDILEDTKCTEEQLREEGISDEAIEMIIGLTRKKDETYFEYINRVNQKEYLRMIKQADIEDNLSRFSRFPRDTYPAELEKRYRNALEILKDRSPYIYSKTVKDIVLSYSDIKENSIYIYCKQPDEKWNFKTAMFRKNDKVEIIGRYGFSDEELKEIARLI